ncbi:MAG: hypothetical protein F4Z93_01340 [Rhodospirillales bacterium]|nr:hypothetical protein [Rhodospirillales bacterium]
MFPVIDIILLPVSRLVSHQTHHRGQVHDMLSQAGATPPELDLIYYVRAL